MKNKDQFFNYSIEEARILKRSLIEALIDKKEVCSIKDISWAYNILECNPYMSNEEIKIAYRKKVKMNHPDQINPNKIDKEIANFAQNRLQEINEAFELLKKDRNL